MIWVTGDIHATSDIHKLNSQNWPEGNTLTRDDYLIICGDFGMPWTGSNNEKHWLNWLNDKPWTTLYVDGNHECYPYLEDLPVTTRWGGHVQQYPDYPNIFRLMRGQVFHLPLGDEKVAEGEPAASSAAAAEGPAASTANTPADTAAIFTMGGAMSHDKEYRIEGDSWWPEELPSPEEYRIAEENLARHNWEVDYVISHCCSSVMTERALLIGNRDHRVVHDGLTSWFDELELKLTFKRWFFGHCHADALLDPRHRILFQDIVKITED